MGGVRRWLAGALERWPRGSWLTAAFGVSVVVAPVAASTGAALAFNSGPYGAGWPVALVLLALGLGVAAIPMLAVSDLPERLFGHPRRRSWLLAYGALGVGVLPWLPWPGPSAFDAGSAPGWAAAQYAVDLLVLPAAAALAVPGRRVKAAGAVALVLLTALWFPVRQSTLAAEARARLAALGVPSGARSLVRLVDWPKAVAGEPTYADGRWTVTYFSPDIIPSPDGNDLGTLVVGPEPSDTMVGVGQRVVLRDGGVVLTLESKDGVDVATLAGILRSRHPATDAEVLDL